VKSKLIQHIIALTVITGVAALFIFPCTINSYWFYLDDPMTLRVSRDLFTNSSWMFPDNSTGRYFPLYWLYHAVIYHAFGESPFAFFLVQSIVILASAFLIYFITLHITENKSGGVIAALLFLTCTAMPENAYTLGKTEPKAMLFLLLALFLLTKYISSDKPRRNYIYIFMISLLMLCAMLIKEVCGLFIVAVMGGFLISCCFSSLYYQRFKLGLLSIALSVAILLSRLPFLFRSHNAINSYIIYDLNFDIVHKNIIFYYEQTPDLFILAAISCILTFFCLFRFDVRLDQKSNIFMTCILSWALFGCYILWRSQMVYYMYFTCGLFSISIMSCSILFKLRSTKNMVFFAMFLLCLALTRLYSIPAFYYIASSQADQSVIYKDIIQEYMKTEYRGRRLFVENWYSFSEMVGKTNLLLNSIYGRTDLRVIGIFDRLYPNSVTPELRRLYQIDDKVKNSEIPRPGDLVLVFNGYKPAHWTIRAISPFINKGEVLLMKNGYQMSLVFNNKITNRVLIFKSIMLSDMQWTDTYLGCNMYKVVIPGRIF
jgi:hypothetical protein